MKPGTILLVLFLLSTTQFAGADGIPRSGPSVDFSHGDLKVSANKRFLVHEDGMPFFYLGDTAWELFHNLDREQAEMYLENRRGKGFTVIQAVALAERDGLNRPNAYGHKPLIDNNPTKPNIKEGPNNDYWDHVDWIIDKAAEKGLFVALLPTWGDKVYKNSRFSIGPVIFNSENAVTYGKWIANRYKDRSNIIWIMGGDRPAVEKGSDFKAVWRAMAQAIKSVDSRHLMTFHPYGGRSSSRPFHKDDWLDFNMLQSGHGTDHLTNYKMINTDYNLRPTKPCMDGEPCYETIPINFTCINGRYSDYEVRRAAYWNLFAGGHGHTYGCNPVWQMYKKGIEPIINPRRYWYEVLDLPGAGDMQHVRALMESRPMLDRVPDQSLIAKGPDKFPDTVIATRGKDYAFIYVPTHKNITVQMGKISGDKVKAWLYDPQAGSAKDLGTFDNTGSKDFGFPWGQDWILVLDDASKNYPAPGTD